MFSTQMLHHRNAASLGTILSIFTVWDHPNFSHLNITNVLFFPACFNCDVTESIDASPILHPKPLPSNTAFFCLSISGPEKHDILQGSARTQGNGRFQCRHDEALFWKSTHKCKVEWRGGNEAAWGGEIQGGPLCRTLRTWELSAGLRDVHSSEALHRFSRRFLVFQSFKILILSFRPFILLPTTCWNSSWRFCSVSFTLAVCFSKVSSVHLWMTVDFRFQSSFFHDFLLGVLSVLGLSQFSKYGPSSLYFFFSY